MSVKNKVLNLLQSKEWVSSEEIEKLFPSGVKGHFSWSQRLRSLRDDGFVITRRIKAGTKNLSEWKLEELPPTEQESAVIRNNYLVEDAINKGQLAFAGMGRVRYGV